MTRKPTPITSKRLTARAPTGYEIRANPIFHGQVGRRKFEEHSVVLSPEETGKKIVDFYRRRPAYTKAVTAMIGLKFKDETEF